MYIIWCSFLVYIDMLGLIGFSNGCMRNFSKGTCNHHLITAGSTGTEMEAATSDLFFQCSPGFSNSDVARTKFDAAVECHPNILYALTAR